MTLVRVLAARRCPPDAEAIAVADVELDAALSVRGVEIVNDPVRGGSRALPPRRPWGDGARVLGWSERVSVAIVLEVRRLLDGETRAVAGADAELERLAIIFPGERTIDGIPEALVPSAELPPDPRAAPRAVALDELVEAIAAEPGIGRGPLAETFEVARDTITAAAQRAEAEGRIRSELNGHGYRYFAVEGAEGAP